MPEITTRVLDSNYTKIVLEPLERGYGQTLGNSLRRVLLSTIQGAAINAIKIKEVLHEFAPIPGVKEDATQLMLNLKDLAIRVDVSEGVPEADQTLKISRKGPGKVTGADVQCPPGVTVVNPEAYICTISDSNQTFEMEMYVGIGSGYRLPEQQTNYADQIGIIRMGAQYTPVTKVNYIVEQTRVGMRTDLERLVLEVWVNGSISPNDAVTQAAKILSKYFELFFELGRVENEDMVALPDEERPDVTHVPDIKIEELQLSQRTLNALKREGLTNLRALAMRTTADLAAIKGFGTKAMVEVRDKMQEYGIEMLDPKGGRRATFSDLDDEDELDDDEF